MQKRHQNKKAYFEEQIHTTREYVIPFIEKFLPLNASCKVLEIGCGEGGNLIPFLDKKCRVTGVDISESKISHAAVFLKTHPGAKNLTLLAKDIYDSSEDLGQDFDLIMMQDVIEHIHDQDRFMGYAKRFLKPEGLFLLIFPPWYNPFGGHQQIGRHRILSKLPYFHLLPGWLYRFVLRTGGESEGTIAELLEIKQTGLSIERFRKIVKKHDYHIIQETLYFINPNYEIKFGLSPRKQSRFIATLPFIRNLFTTSVYYLIRKNQ
ncbi:MAG: methyltransferase domain-containing protein [Bacteroidales bacterium]|nr:methyltransferase domain-containing protein [Bacteroidales bacterium]